MKNLKVFTEKEKKQLLKKRKGETKFGEYIQLMPHSNSIYESIKDLDVDYVLFGICEAIGVYANYGKLGAHKAWETTLKILLNIPKNTLINANRVLILGHLEYDKAQNIVELKPSKQNIVASRHFVEIIDKDVTFLMSSIIKAGKTPIIIGGGHNNAYGNIKGLALAKQTKVNVINFDAHTDLRTEEGRHSGNGFSYAYNEGFLKNYFMFGLHENYISDTMFEYIKNVKSFKYNTYEALQIRNELEFYTELEHAKNHISDKNFGVELDCDAIENIPSSTMSSGGFSIKQARQFTTYFAKHKNASYLHICEASPTKKTVNQVGKLITYLITDFIKANTKTV